MSPGTLRIAAIGLFLTCALGTIVACGSEPNAKPSPSDVNAGTWSWDGTQWHRLASQPCESSYLGGFESMAYDSAKGRLIEVSADSGGTAAFRTRGWDGKHWSDIDRTSGPTKASVLSAVASDSLRKTVVWFGRVGTGMETWIWDGSRWSQQHPNNSPSFRNSTAMNFDEAMGEVVLFGGVSGNNVFSDTWTWDGINWHRRTTSVAPTAIDPTIAYDPATRRVVAFGGLKPEGGMASDTWTWDGANWHQERPTVSPPSGDGYMAYAANSGGVLLALTPTVIGATTKFWLWKRGAWLMLPSNWSPSVLAMAADPSNGAVVACTASGGGGFGLIGQASSSSASRY